MWTCAYSSTLRLLSHAVLELISPRMMDLTNVIVVAKSFVILPVLGMSQALQGLKQPVQSISLPDVVQEVGSITIIHLSTMPLLVLGIRPQRRD